ncbi:putative glycosyltransferase [Frankia casuarinae]|nr:MULTISPECIES: glycosyltransferase family 2 protein [Frankia]ETA00662.1 putative glycosyltransferase [Frankia sp. CcI6]EYT91370.1 putative glycosyltransferase [Frankia casuarinae]KDA41776.1 putative glycosyltransferase [Frankia sp. BMG5.23]KEZ37475.1 putative glycosyltransferase [Frankia sp. CeD]OAA28887.1 putative glycosyltransferase [Frankia casuarinae]
MHRLLAVVVSHGGSTSLYRLLTTLDAMAECRVFLVENDGKSRHDALPDGVRVVQGHGNVGYGTAVNLAVRRALEDGLRPEWILVVNSDVTVPADTATMIPKLLAWAPSSADVVGFPIRGTAGERGRASAVLPRPRTNAYTAVRGEIAAVERWPELRYPVGAFFAVRSEIFLRLGGFDPSYWMYYEETDLFARLHAAGGRIVWADDAWPVVHVGGETVGRSGLLYAELGRSAATYARRHRHDVGRSWTAVHAAQLTVLAARKLAVGRSHDALRAVRILSGLVSGLARPGWEPAVSSRWHAVPAETRLRLGHLRPVPRTPRQRQDDLIDDLADGSPGSSGQRT